jgi:hypothetical protein
MNDETTLLSNGLPPPPIPQRLREMLKDYPEHLKRIQEVLDHILEKPRIAKLTPTGAFEEVVWALESRTSAFIREAQAELEATQAGGDVEEITRAEAKEDLMFCVGDINNGLKGLHELWDYFQAHKENFK